MPSTLTIIIYDKWSVRRKISKKMKMIFFLSRNKEKQKEERREKEKATENVLKIIYLIESWMLDLRDLGLKMSSNSA